MGGGQLDHRVVHGKGEMHSQITCGSVIETAYVHYGSFLLFLSQHLQSIFKLAHQSPFLGYFSDYCPCCQHPETAGIVQYSRQQHSA